ncbi:MAG: transglutaminase-like domain-containing protein [Spirochaetota bacterium]
MDRSGTVIASKTTTAEIIASQTLSLSVQLIPIVGIGQFGFSVSWPNTRKVDSVVAILRSSADSSTTLKLLPTGSSVSYSGSLASGSYVLLINFSLSSKIIAVPMTESLLIYAGKSSNATLSLPDDQFNVVTSNPQITEGFESSDLSAYNWTTSGTTLPNVTGDKAHLGMNSTVFNTTTWHTGSTSSLSIVVNPTVASTVSYWQKTDIGTDVATVFQFFIDGVKQGEWNGLEGSWTQYSFPVPAGSHMLAWTAVKSSSSSYRSATNSVFLDDVSLIPDVTAAVQLGPRGKLDSYVGMQPILFSATAHRTDGSIKARTTFTYAVVTIDGGAGLISPAGSFTPTKSGTCCVVATSSDGLSATSQTITIHPANFRSLPVTYAGSTYNGQTTSGTGDPLAHSYQEISISSPTASTFDADAFFTLEGTISAPLVYNYAYIEVKKDGNPAGTTSYFPRSDFSTRIWMRFGTGAYTVSVYKLMSLAVTLGGEGDFSRWSFASPAAYTFHVNNTRSEDGITLYPSDEIQSDDFRIGNIAKDLSYGLAKDTDKIKAIHDFVVTTLYYDTLSADFPEVRKKQNALAALDNGTAVCEGYTSLATALLRNMGIRAKAIAGLGDGGPHAWNNVLVGTTWLFLDTTWDDPNPVKGDPRISTAYYLLDSLTGIGGDHVPQDQRPERDIVAGAPFWRGHPDGWY